MLDMTAEIIKEHFKAHFSQYGVPELVISNNSRQFGGRHPQKVYLPTLTHYA